MDRLTRIDGTGDSELIKCFDCNPGIAGHMNENCGMCENFNKLIDKLSAYEDMLLSPDEVLALKLNQETYYDKIFALYENTDTNQWEICPGEYIGFDRKKRQHFIDVGEGYNFELDTFDTKDIFAFHDLAILEQGRRNRQ